MSTAVADKTPILDPHDAGRPMTPEEYEAADYEEGYRYEASGSTGSSTTLPVRW